MKLLPLKFILITIIFSGCNTNVPDDTIHDHGPEPLSYTVYTDKTELFVEFKPLVAGSVSSFATHVTVLGENFVPLTSGSVTVSLIVDEKGIRNTADSASSPGIFRLALKPIRAGTGKLIFDINSPLFNDRVILDNIKVHSNEESVQNVTEENKNGLQVPFLKEQAWRTEFATIPVQLQEFHNVIKTSGMILSAPGDEMIITSPAPGNVSLTGTATVIGKEVKKGEKLFTLSAGRVMENNVDVAFQQAKANFENSKATFERASELVKDRIISEKQFQQAKLDYENSRLVYNNYAKNYSSGGLQITSPMDGFVKNIMVKDGQSVESGTALASVSKNKKLILQANVSQKYFNELSSVRSAMFKPVNSEEFYNTENLGGKIISFGKSSATESPFIPVTFEIDNTGKLISGSVTEVYLKTTSINNALVIPSSSLIEEQGNFYVYVQTAGESFEKREVATGASDGKNVQVVSGLKEGERVVNKGAYQIKLSSSSGTVPAHGHAH